MSDVDLVIVGSGPAGSAIARTVADQMPDARILLVEAGPALGGPVGGSVRNLIGEERRDAERISAGPQMKPTGVEGTWVRPDSRPGTTYLVNGTPYENAQSGMPAAVIAANVGGLGVHWTGACPRPGDSERIPFVPEGRMEQLLSEAERLLCVTQNAYAGTPVRSAIERELGRVLNKGRPVDRRVQAMPLAALPTAGGQPRWVGTDSILGNLVTEVRPTFELRASTLAERLLHDGNRVSAVVLRDIATGESYEVTTKQVAVAADAFRTPQLLWASGIRPDALGRYLNDQPQIMCGIHLNPSLVNGEVAIASADDPRDIISGVSWIPFHLPEYPFHGQIMQRDASPIGFGEMGAAAHRAVVGLGCFTTKEIRAEDRVRFSDTKVDRWGMPQPIIDYELTPLDLETIERALTIVSGLVARLGEPLPGGEPRLLPAGSSIHYQGTYRMGESDDGASVVDPEGRVWHFENLFLAGNGVIPTATACNPTLTNVALAVGAGQAILRELD